MLTDGAMRRIAELPAYGVTATCLAKRTRAGCATGPRWQWAEPWPPSRVSVAFQGLARSMTGATLKDVIAQGSRATALPVDRTRAGSVTESELLGAEPCSEPALIFRCNPNLQTRDI